MLTDLIERLEKEGGSKELDAEICALRYRTTHPDTEKHYCRAEDEVCVVYFRDAQGKLLHNTRTGFPAYTTSLDAAIALCERVLPGWCWKVGTCHVSDDAWVCPNWNDPVHGERLKAELGEPEFGTWKDVGFDVDLRPSGRVPVALCIAILKALRALEDGK